MEKFSFIQILGVFPYRKTFLILKTRINNYLIYKNNKKFNFQKGIIFKMSKKC